MPDLRHARGKRHALPAVLLLTCVAMLCGATSPAAIADWAANYGEPWRRRLGLTHPRGPSQPTLSRLFGRIDPVVLEQHLSCWAEQVMALLPVATTADAVPLTAIAVDGNTLRGSKKRGAAGTHLLSAISQRLGVVLGQLAVAEKQNEIDAAPDRLTSLVLTGRLVTVDALLTQTQIAQTILDRGGACVMVVKENQPTLHEDLLTLFDDPTTPVRVAMDIHLPAGRVQPRRLAASTELLGDTDWPGFQQALCLDRTVLQKTPGVRHTERA